MVLDSLESGSPRRDWKVISLEDLSLHYETDSDADTVALENINLDICEGEFVCLLGPSGCGKSTLLKIIAGLIEPTRGSAKLDGEEIAGPDWQRGVVFQQPPLYPWLTVEQNVSFGPRMRRLPAAQIRERTAAFLKEVGLSEFARQRPYELSGGMRQRVAIARVLVNDPRILLMDEPFGALDALTREQMQTLVRGVWADTGKTILFITHDVDEALSLGTRVLVMSKRPGRIVQEFQTGFTYSITPDNANYTRFSKEFQKVREKILALINGQMSEYNI